MFKQNVVCVDNGINHKKGIMDETSKYRDGSMVKSTLAAFPEDPDSMPNTHIVAHKLSLNSSSEGT